jgi:hypothetical protein
VVNTAGKQPAAAGKAPTVAGEAPAAAGKGAGAAGQGRDAAGRRLVAAGEERNAKTPGLLFLGLAAALLDLARPAGEVVVDATARSVKQLQVR